MPALFPRWTNTLSRVLLLIALGTPVAAIGGLMVYVRSPWVTGEDQPIEQPVMFDHRHHAGDEGIDCRYCHTTVESSPHAGIPPAATCMGCHAQIWNQSPKLAPVRRAFFEGTPIRWNRVHRVPDFVYFDHSIHVAKGVGCVTCHGRVDQMAYVEQAEPLTMAWCLDCHRDPDPHLRPLDRITSMEPYPRSTEVRDDVATRTSCTTCHR